MNNLLQLAATPVYRIPSAGQSTSSRAIPPSSTTRSASAMCAQCRRPRKSAHWVSKISFEDSKISTFLGSREQMNQATSYLDGSGVYGNTADKAEELRSFRDGKLKVTDVPNGKDLLPQVCCI